jgi:ATP-dependent Zn protease
MKRHILIIALFLTTGLIRAEETPIEHITYDEFLHAVDAGQIKEVRFYNISGLEGAIQTPNGLQRFDSARAFQTADDPLLLRLMREKGVKIEQSEDSKFHPRYTGFNSWQLMQLGFPITVALLVIAILQFRSLRRLEKRANPEGRVPR